MGFKWEVEGLCQDPVTDLRHFTIREEDGKDWGRDVVPIKSTLRKIYLVSTNKKGFPAPLVSILPNNGVITMREGCTDIPIYLGVNIGGYSYEICGSSYTVEEYCPFTTARLNVTTKEEEILDRHFYIRYKIKAVNIGNNKIELDEPVIKEVLIGFNDHGGFHICI